MIIILFSTNIIGKSEPILEQFIIYYVLFYPSNFLKLITSKISRFRIKRYL